MLSNPEIQYEMARARLNELAAEAAAERRADEVRRATPNFVPANGLRDTAFWASLIGPVVGLGFVAYFVQQIGRPVS